MSTPTAIERLANLTNEERIDLANALRYFCPRSISNCTLCPLYSSEHVTELEPPCLALRAESEYFKRTE